MKKQIKSKIKSKKLMKLVNYIETFQYYYKHHNVTAFSAQIAFFFTLSMFPFAIFLLSLLSTFDIDYNAITNTLKLYMNSSASNQLVDYFKNAVVPNSSTVLPISLIIMLFSASRAVTSIIRSINVVYHVKETRNYIHTRLLGMFYLLILTVLIVLSIVTPDWGYRLNEMMQPYVSRGISVGFIQLFSLIRMITIPVGFLLIFASIYVLLPNRKVKFREAYLGALFGIIASLVSTYAFTYFIETFTNYSVVYGSMSTVIILMLWLYLLGHIIIIGAELNVIFLMKDHDISETETPTLVEKIKYSVQK